MSYKNSAAVAVLTMASAFSAQAACQYEIIINPDGTRTTRLIPGTCPTPSPTPSPNPTQPPVVNNGGAGGAGGQGGQGGAGGQGGTGGQGGAGGNAKQKQDQFQSQNQNQNQSLVSDNTNVNNVTSRSGDSLSLSQGGSAYSEGGNSSANNSNNSSYTNNSTYKAAAASAISGGFGTTGHGCFAGKANISLGVMAIAGGFSATAGGGEKYNKDCANDQVILVTIANGGVPHATDGQIALAVETAAAASPQVRTAVDRVMDATTGAALVATFGRKAPAAPVATLATAVTPQQQIAPTTHNLRIVVENPPPAKPDCKPGTTPVWDATKNVWVCQPG